MLLELMTEDAGARLETPHRNAAMHALCHPSERVPKWIAHATAADYGNEPPIRDRVAADPELRQSSSRGCSPEGAPE